ncbi:AraC family transcriptional regulator [Chryseobacterium nematophagum]|uniref:AraC family transcriptional regulator n=1 Tax=Chryseobacterium nematophagum TaxID=2305228 RepID=A0A3M7LAU6_9FLAO|nr:AraC family transcriptional regulator [Chryseobacterium nematophagum]RMZ59165.1 AraC family transcriptional regulator [Chryseobacterium nematophagum]
MPKVVLIFLFILYQNLFFSQSVREFQVPDSLKTKSFEQLEKSYSKTFQVNNKAILYANTFLTKAKKEHNIVKQIDGYFLIFTKSKNIYYIDSIQSIIKKSNKIDHISHGNYKIGNIYYNSGKYDLALSSYVQALTYAKKDNDKKRIVLIKNAIGDIKFLISDYEEAIQIFRQNYKYIKYKESEDPSNYLSILFSLANTYNAIGKHDSAYIYGNLGKSKSLLYQRRYYIKIFDISNHITEYYLKNYPQSIVGLKKNINSLKKNDIGNLQVTYMYLSLNYQKLNNEREYLHYFTKMDSLQKKTNIVDKNLIELYKNSLRYYEKEGNQEKQLYLIDRLIKLNQTIYKSNYTFSKEIHQKFDTPELLEQKEKLISNLDNRNTILYWLLGGGLILLFIFIYLYNINRKNLKIYQIQAQKLVDKPTERLTIDQLDLESQVIQIDTSLTIDEKTDKVKNQTPESVQLALLVKLHEFENSKSFLNKNMNLYFLSKELNTNTTYLSRSINELKGKNFSKYLNELRINFVITELKSDKKLRLKTIAVIAEEAGYNNVESFTKAFKNITGTLPSYFIKALR